MELLRYGYFVPESRNRHGAHQALTRKLCGQELREHEQSAVADFARALDSTPSAAVIISSEELEELLRQRHYAQEFFDRIRELNLQPKLVLFPRNQSQQINSLYSSVVRRFRVSEPFEAFVQEIMQRPDFRCSPLIGLADVHDAELIVQPFTTKTISHGVVPEFLQVIGLDPSPFQDTNVRRNKDVGPFTVSVARSVLRLIGRTGNQLKWLQGVRCGTRLAAYLEEKGWADSDYCGLTTALARQIENEFRPDNDVFAQRIWGTPWAEVFADDVIQEFAPNDFDMCPPDESTARQLGHAIREMIPIVEEVLLDPAIAVETPWNDLLARSGWTPTA